MAGDRKLSRETIKQLISDQLLAASPASLSEEVIIKGLSYVIQGPNVGYISDILGEMVADRLIVKIIEDHVGPRFTLVSGAANTCEEHCDD
ncbi:MAG: hypothetical protein LBF42_01645 [Puniceicoccales bacterium]|nr:hypothetical protein [Puniceicoccales bacterium]